MLQAILLVILIFVSAALIGIILMQRSEGGALGMGGGPSGFMSTRGVGDLLTRTTAILAGIFFLLCIVLTVVSGRAHHGQSVVDRLKIDSLDASALAPKRPAPPPANGLPAAPIFQAPAPEVHTAPAATAPLRAPVTPAKKMVAKPAPTTIVPSKPIATPSAPPATVSAPPAANVAAPAPIPAASAPANTITPPKA